MHAHVTFLRNNLYARDPGYDEATSERTLRMLLAYGITTVRNPAAPPEDGVAPRNAVASGRVLGPRIFTAGIPFNGQFRTEDEIRSEMRREVRLGVDYIKVYAASSPQETAITIDEAHRQGLKVIGHLQNTDTHRCRGWHRLYRSCGELVYKCSAPVRRSQYESLTAAEHGIRLRIFWLESVDVNGLEMDRIIRSLKEHNISVDPTLIVYATKFVPQPAYQGEENVRLAPMAMQEDWKKFSLTKDWTTEDFERMKLAWPKMLQIVARYYRDGVQLTTGSDLPNRFVGEPGINLHQEMELLAEAGIPAQAILQMATRNAASALGTLSGYGTITVGKHADLVLLRADPLKNIRNTRTIRYVFLDGRMFDPESLLRE